MVRRFLWFGTIVGVTLLVSLFAFSHFATAQETDGKLVTVYDRGVQRVFVSQEKTIGAALKAQGFELDPHDAVQPAVDEEMVAPDYRVNIYRARPVTVEDGSVRRKIMTPYQSTERIVKSADIELNSEDTISLVRSSNYLEDGAGLVLKIKRATTFIFDLYGKKTEARTQAATIREMLEEKKITLGVNDRVSLPLETPMSAGLEVRVWREGKQTITEEQPIAFASEIVYDADRPVGYRGIKTEGVPGVRAVTYEIEIKEGAEVSRKSIAQIVTAEPKKQQLAIGIKGLENGLTRSKGALQFRDSKGVVHRETYYDLPMNVVMQACGQGGQYTVRFDGMKIDSEGYILIAANYARYPKCSIVETSAGPGRVYDTGGFVSHHPDGFDLATDWTNNNGR